MTQRQRLPNRRQSEVVTFAHDQVKYHGGVTWFDGVGVAEDGALRLGSRACPAEVFLDAGKPGSPMNGIARDLAVTASLAFQHGCSLDTLRAALTRGDDDAPAGPLGKLLDLIAEGEPG